MILFSVNRVWCSSEENLDAVKDACKQLGSYTSGSFFEGDVGTCFLTVCDVIAKDLAHTYNQYCYFERGHYGYWYLIETRSGDVLDVFKGIFEKSIDWPEHNPGEPYTLINGRVFVAEK
jgi:hypothetical protein